MNGDPNVDKTESRIRSLKKTVLAARRQEQTPARGEKASTYSRYHGYPGNIQSMCMHRRAVVGAYLNSRRTDYTPHSRSRRGRSNCMNRIIIISIMKIHNICIICFTRVFTAVSCMAESLCCICNVHLCLVVLVLPRSL